MSRDPLDGEVARYGSNAGEDVAHFRVVKRQCIGQALTVSSVCRAVFYLAAMSIAAFSSSLEDVKLRPFSFTVLIITGLASGDN